MSCQQTAYGKRREKHQKVHSIFVLKELANYVFFRLSYLARASANSSGHRISSKDPRFQELAQDAPYLGHDFGFLPARNVA